MTIRRWASIFRLEPPTRRWAKQKLIYSITGFTALCKQLSRFLSLPFKIPVACRIVAISTWCEAPYNKRFALAQHKHCTYPCPAFSSSTAHPGQSCSMTNLLYLVFLFTLLFRASLTISQPAALPSNVVHGLRLKAGCHRSQVDSFYACNCFFIINYRTIALAPRSRIDPRLLNGARTSCMKKFGGLKRLRKQCMRIAHPRRPYFRKSNSLRGMKALVKRCHSRK